MPDRIFEKAFWSGLLFGFTDSLASGSLLRVERTSL
jgi:hypothetical protein